ncbi:MAG: methyltransferase domain-containing protein [Nitrospinales bacterium]
MINNKCRFCSSPLKTTFANLGMSPLSNSYLSPEDLKRMEPFYPLHAFVCEKLYLVQLQEYQSTEKIFKDYSYFSSFSETWLKHAQKFVDDVIGKFGLDKTKQVVEVASNDGYLLQYFHERGFPVLGIEPAKNVAEAAINAGIPTTVKFFGVQTAEELAVNGKKADLLIGNNVLAHVPDLNDFVKGLKILLKSDGIITMEFPHLMRLIEGNQFDTIYHEHFSYFSFTSAKNIFFEHGLKIFDVDELSTHGGSLRIYACHSEDQSKVINQSVENLLESEEVDGFKNLKFYLTFNKKVKAIKRSILDFMNKIKNEGKSIVGYGAPAKGNTLLNYCGIGRDYIDYTVDRSPHKQGYFLPGTHIPIYPPDKIKETQPDYVVILPWNLKDEIMEQMAHIRDWSGQFVILIPEIKIYS